LDQKDAGNRGNAPSGTPLRWIFHSLQNRVLQSSDRYAEPEIPNADTNRFTRNGLKCSERQMKLLSELVGSEHRLGQVIFGDFQKRQLHDETTPMAFAAGDLNLGAMRGANGLRDGQAQSRPA
jgi:hypothetical protein